MNIREEIMQKLYEMMSTESGVHDEVDEYDNVLNAICEYERATFFAGASMVLDFISGNEVR